MVKQSVCKRDRHLYHSSFDIHHSSSTLSLPSISNSIHIPIHIHIHISIQNPKSTYTSQSPNLTYHKESILIITKFFELQTMEFLLENMSCNVMSFKKNWHAPNPLHTLIRSTKTFMRPEFFVELRIHSLKKISQ